MSSRAVGGNGGAVFGHGIVVKQCTAEQVPWTSLQKQRSLGTGQCCAEVSKALWIGAPCE
jgi:hypothetical protein